jgi:hypothetical protein
MQLVLVIVVVVVAVLTGAANSGDRWRIGAIASAELKWLVRLCSAHILITESTRRSAIIRGRMHVVVSHRVNCGCAAESVIRSPHPLHQLICHFLPPFSPLGFPSRRRGWRFCLAADNTFAPVKCLARKNRPYCDYSYADRPQAECSAVCCINRTLR